MMRTHHLIFAFLLLFCHLSTCAPKCSSTGQSPLTIPIRNVTVDSPTVRRGVALSVGTPPQDISLEVAPWVNNTFIFDQSGQCSASNPPAQCAGFRGSAFNEDASSTWVPGLESTDPIQEDMNIQDYPAPTNDSQDVFGQDNLHLNSSTFLASFPFHVPRFVWDGEASLLGLGSQSTFLSGLQNAAIIPSRTWAYWFGYTGLGKQMDGAMVFGGYDAAKTTGQNYTAQLDSSVDSCPTRMLVTVTDISMKGSDGTETSVLGTSHGSALRMCIDPSYPVITLPMDIWTAFSDNAGGTFLGRSLGINLFGMLYSAQDVYSGDITFTIDSGLKITIPNHELVQPDIHYDTDGNIIYNDTTREIFLNSLQAGDADDQPKLGHTFLTSAYLLVDQDDNSFTLWEANPTTDEKLVSIGSKAKCDDTPAGSSSSVPQKTNAPTATPATSPAHSNTGAIVGGVVGGLAAVMLALIAFLAYRRKKNASSARNSEASTTALNAAWEGRYSQRSYIKPELAGDHAHELNGSRPVFEMI